MCSYNNYQTSFIFILHFLLISICYSHPGQDSFSLKIGQDDSTSNAKHLDNEFQEFEERLKRLKQILAEESHKGQHLQEPNKTTQSSAYHGQPFVSPSPTSSSLGTQNKESQKWFKSNQEHSEAAKLHLDERISELLEMFNPGNFLPTMDDLFKPLNAMRTVAQQFIPDPLRSFGNVKKMTEFFSKFMSRDIPQVLQRMPEALEGMIHTLDVMRKNGTESARNETLSLYVKLSKNLFVWSVLMAQTDLMATLSLSLVYRVFIHVLKATPLPTEVMKMQTALNLLSSDLTKTIPLTIKVLSAGPFGDSKNDLNSLLKNIEETNGAMDSLQNQTNALQQIMDRTPTTSYIFDQQSLDGFQDSVVTLFENIENLPKNIPLVTSLLFSQNEHLIRFLTQLSRTFVENGVGLKIPENINNIQKRIQQIFNIKELPFFNSTNPIGKAAINLLVQLQSLIFAANNSLLTSRAILSTRPLIAALDGCVDALNAFQSVNTFVPNIVVQPLLLSLQLMSKILKFGTLDNQ